MNTAVERRVLTGLYLADGSGMAAGAVVFFEKASTAAQELGSIGLGAMALGFLGAAALEIMRPALGDERPE